MNKYMEEFRKMLVKSQGDLSIHGQVFYIKKNELKKLIILVKKVCEKSQMYDDLCKQNSKFEKVNNGTITI